MIFEIRMKKEGNYSIEQTLKNQKFPIMDLGIEYFVNNKINFQDCCDIGTTLSNFFEALITKEKKFNVEHVGGAYEIEITSLDSDLLKLVFINTSPNKKNDPVIKEITIKKTELISALEKFINEIIDLIQKLNNDSELLFKNKLKDYLGKIKIIKNEN